MNTILDIIEKRGGLGNLMANGNIKIENPPYMKLNIDYLGNGPNGHPMIAIAHNYIQNGDVMADPDMQCEIAPGLSGEMELYPFTYRQDNLGIFQQVYTIDENGKIVGMRLELKKELESFLRKWESNLRQQGFLKVA